VSTKLKTTRQQKGLTQVQVAKTAKVSIRAYQQYESGERTPNAITAKLIAQALNSTVEELF
jgi:transcriptional regulator with XRE-family HTH domain